MTLSFYYVNNYLSVGATILTQQKLKCCRKASKIMYYYIPKNLGNPSMQFRLGAYCRTRRSSLRVRFTLCSPGVSGLVEHLSTLFVDVVSLSHQADSDAAKSAPAVISHLLDLLHALLRGVSEVVKRALQVGHTLEPTGLPQLCFLRSLPLRNQGSFREPKVSNVFWFDYLIWVRLNVLEFVLNVLNLYPEKVQNHPPKCSWISSDVFRTNAVATRVSLQAKKTGGSTCNKEAEFAEALLLTNKPFAELSNQLTELVRESGLFRGRLICPRFKKINQRWIDVLLPKYMTCSRTNLPCCQSHCKWLSIMWDASVVSCYTRTPILPTCHSSASHFLYNCSEATTQTPCQRSTWYVKGQRGI